MHPDILSGVGPGDRYLQAVLTTAAAAAAAASSTAANTSTAAPARASFDGHDAYGKGGI